MYGAIRAEMPELKANGAEPDAAWSSATHLVSKNESAIIGFGITSVK